MKEIFVCMALGRYWFVNCIQELCYALLIRTLKFNDDSLRKCLTIQLIKTTYFLSYILFTIPKSVMFFACNLIRAYEFLKI